MKPMWMKLGVWSFLACLLAGCGWNGETLILLENYWAIEERDPPYTVGEMKARYGEPDEVVSYDYNEGMVYSRHGVMFTCDDPSDEMDKIEQMVVSSPFKLRTQDGFVLGESTTADAEKKWGKINWFYRSDLPDYSRFRRHAIRFLVPRDPKQAAGDKEDAMVVGRAILPYYALKRLKYVPPTPVEIKADAVALEERTEDIEAHLKQVFIETLDLDLDAINDPDWNSLWDNFANRPYEKQFNSISNQDWFEKRKHFEAELLKRANKDEVERLARILDSIRPESDDRTARIPVCAFRARKGVEPVWIIVTKWEHAGAVTRTNIEDEWAAQFAPEKRHEIRKKKIWSSLGHILIPAFRVSDGECIDAIQCG
jgi:hypothetical protein